MSVQATRVSWKQLSPIFADVVLSPWNLLVGGLLIHYLKPADALLSIVIGYTILGIVFILYGGLGFKRRIQSAQIFKEVFSGQFSSIFIPLLLAFGQIGWASINISLGGTSFARLLHIPVFIGLIMYALAITAMGAIGLYKLAYAKFVIIISSISLAIYIGALKIHSGQLAHFINYHPTTQKSIYWGSSIVVASLISFATVSPDFFQSLKHKTDIGRSTIFGIVIPGIVICFTGCLFFYNVPLNLAGLIAGLSFAGLANVFNTVANTDGAMALYTPALKFQLIFKMKFIIGISIAAIISLTFALLGIINYLEIWLKALTIIAPIFIGVAFAAVLFDRKTFKNLPKAFSKYAYVLTVAICILALGRSVPVYVALLTPLVIYSMFIQFKKIHE